MVENSQPSDVFTTYKNTIRPIVVVRTKTFYSQPVVTLSADMHMVYDRVNDAFDCETNLKWCKSKKLAFYRTGWAFGDWPRRQQQIRSINFDDFSN